MTSDDETPKKNLNPLEGLELDDDLEGASPEDLEDIDEIEEIIEASPLGSELDQEAFSDDDGDDFAAELSAMPTSSDDMDEIDDLPSYDHDDEDGGNGKGGGGMKKMLAPVMVLVIAAGAAGYIMMNPGVLSGLTGGATTQAPAPAKPAFDAQAEAAKRKAESDALAKAQAAAAAKKKAEAEAAKKKSLEAALPQPTATTNADSQMAAVDSAATNPDKTIDALLDAGEEMKSGSADDAKVPAPKKDDVAFANDLPQEVSVDTPEMKKERVAAVKEETLPRPPRDALTAVPDDSATSAKADKDTAKVETAKVTPKSEPTKVAQADVKAPVKTAAEKVEEAPKASAPVKPAPAAKDVEKSEPAKVSSDKAENDIFEEDFKSISDANAGKKSAAIPAKKPAQAKEEDDTKKSKDAFYDSEVQIPGSQVSGIRELNPRIEPATKFVVATTDAKKDDQESLVVAANRALKLRRYDAARDMFEKLYAKNKRDKRILMGLAVAQQNTGRPESAIKTYEELIDIDPNNADAMVNMLGLIRSQYPSVALRRLLDLQDKYPSNAGIAAQIGVTEADLGKYDEAVRYLTQAATLEPQNAQHMFNLAIVSDRQGKTKQAIDYYQQALEVDTVYGGGKTLPRDTIYDRLATLRRR